MKKLYSLVAFSFLLLIASKSFSQSTYSFTVGDTVEYGIPKAELICTATLVNNTSDTIKMKITREQNVSVDAPTWKSAFCMYVCYLPSVSVVNNFKFLPNTTVNFTFHMYTDSVTADHATAKMKFENLSVPSNSFAMTLFGSTDGTLAGTNDVSTNASNVSIYPMPIASGEVFSMNITNVQAGKETSLVVYNMFGSIVNTFKVSAGINFMTLDLPAGVYSYSLISGDEHVNSGKLVMQ